MPHTGSFGSHAVDRRIGDFRLTITAHTALARTPEHDHPFACLHWILDGLYVEIDECGVAIAGRGSLLRKARAVPHRNLFGATNAMSLRIEHARLDAFATRPALHIQHDMLVSDRLATTLDALARSVCSQAPASALMRTLDDVMTLLPHAGEFAEDDAAESAERQAAWLLSRRTDITIAEVADVLAVHRGHLARRFRRRFGCSPKEFSTRARLNRFATGLVRAEHDLSTLALRAGFFDQSHATAAFRDRLGAAPGRWAAALDT
jgi:AraC-like DNA-binding protein